jgi:hypothetical protein
MDQTMEEKKGQKVKKGRKLVFKVNDEVAPPKSNNFFKTDGEKSDITQS